MAIVWVLWGVALLAVSSLSLLWNSTMSHRLVHNAFEVAKMTATAEAAINLAVLALLDPRPERRWRRDGVAQDLEFNGIKVKISIQDELGRIDLNQADTPLIVGLLRSAGLDQQAASAQADKILDWRDAAPTRRLNGAKEQAYRMAGMPHRPRNGPFQSVDELLLVMDMTPALFKRIAPAVTVYSGRPLFDPQVAPREALLALPNMDAAKVDAIIAARTFVQGPNVTSAEDTLPLWGRAFSIYAEFGQPYQRHVQEATIRLTQDADRPYWVLNWGGR